MTVHVILIAMTLTFRRVLISFMLIPAVLGILAAAGTWLAWSRNLLDFGQINTELTTIWWGFTRPATAEDLPWALAAVSWMCLFPLITEIFLHRRFNRSSSLEIFFFRMFLLTLPLQAVRLVLLLIPITDLSLVWALPLTRLAWFARFLGLAALFNVSLYSEEFLSRRSGSVLLMGVLSAFILATIMPLDFTQFMGNLLYRSGNETILGFFCFTMEILAVMTLFIMSAKQENRRFLSMGLAFLAAVAGMELLFFASRPLALPGGLLLGLGSVFFVREIRRIYQWL